MINSMLIERVGRMNRKINIYFYYVDIMLILSEDLHICIVIASY